MDECTWEPKENIPEFLLRTLYDSPEVAPERLTKARAEFLSGLKLKLKSKSVDPMMTCNCDHDIFRYIFNNKGYPSELRGAIMLDKEDFSRFLLPTSWYYCLDKSGEGREVEFPVRAKLHLKKSTKHFILNNSGILVEAPTYLFEVVTFYITKTPCSKDSLLDAE